MLVFIHCNPINCLFVSETFLASHTLNLNHTLILKFFISFVSFLRSFSVVFKHRTLDLDCKSSEERDAWVVAFRWLRRFATGVSFPFLVRHVTHVSPELIWSGPRLLFVHCSFLIVVCSLLISHCCLFTVVLVARKLLVRIWKNRSSWGNYWALEHLVVYMQLLAPTHKATLLSSWCLLMTHRVRMRSNEK